MNENVKIYFVSDLHLGVDGLETSRDREIKFVRWLDFVSHDATEIYFLGDIFDMWFEYKRAVPKGFTRVLGKFSELSDKGIRMHYFTGNHDMWVKNYFEQEMGMRIYREPILKQIANKNFYLGHGDGLGNGDFGYKFIKRVFAGKINQWLFSQLHPNFAMGIADFFSKKSRAANGKYDADFQTIEQESLVHFCRHHISENQVDYYIFGHRHLKMDVEIGLNSRYINLGQWLSAAPYAVFDGKVLELKEFKS